MKNRILFAGAVACALALGGCLTSIDAEIAKISDRLAARCVELQTAVTAVDLLAPEKVRAATADARGVFDRFCAKPPRTSAELLIAIADVIRAKQAVDAAKRAST
ncbi:MULTISPECIES: hypothetical protein [unclassified Bosea (in: a-proteobacteria)]|uniref:hypothetical protein n=1 Tax=unclassified Bosea (in: a-proteobacteria) TaxID=2653178 RepID=UPI000F7532D5|nr:MULTISPECIES: hypothetical protein [unclassified Bosea (in: a-proteobacteria)]AZO77460.1 hypothetical protein BLM15_07435 [Bosea sp. Tri-49]RXT18066.1 hypothetical protein B5U98_22590 [Bosea sp. Tri-39]RXT32664.1 hypothetical protein B5U99_28935 [Bosea sp. Tri-54]